MITVTGGFSRRLSTMTNKSDKDDPSIIIISWSIMMGRRYLFSRFCLPQIGKNKCKNAFCLPNSYKGLAELPKHSKMTFTLFQKERQKPKPNPKRSHKKHTLTSIRRQPSSTMISISPIRAAITFSTIMTTSCFTGTTTSFPLLKTARPAAVVRITAAASSSSCRMKFPSLTTSSLSLPIRNERLTMMMFSSFDENNNNRDDKINIKSKGVQSKPIPIPKRRIIGYTKDFENHWVAYLECGHNQHVRHNPPMMERPWVLTKEGRNSMLGYPLGCKKCLMPNAPKDHDYISSIDRSIDQT